MQIFNRMDWVFFLSYFHPVDFAVVEDEHQRCDGPAGRVADNHPVEVLEHRYKNQCPGHTEDADAHTGQQHRHQRVAAAADHAGENLDADVADIEWSHHVGDADTNFQYSRVGGEQAQQLGGEQAEDQTDAGTCREGHAKTGSDRGTNTVIAARTVVLTDEGGDGNTESADNHPMEAVNLTEGCPCGNGIGAEGVDTGLQEDV